MYMKLVAKELTEAWTTSMKSALLHSICLFLRSSYWSLATWYSGCNVTNISHLLCALCMSHQPILLDLVILKCWVKRRHFEACCMHFCCIFLFLSFRSEYVIRYPYCWKVNFLICTPLWHRGREEAWLDLFITALDRGHCLASLRGRFIPGERSPVSHWIEDWVGCGADLDVLETRKVSTCREWNFVFSVVTMPNTLSRLIACTDWKSYVRVIVTDLENCALSSRMKGSSAGAITGVNEQLYKEESVV